MARAVVKDDGHIGSKGADKRGAPFAVDRLSHVVRQRPFVFGQTQQS